MRHLLSGRVNFVISADQLADLITKATVEIFIAYVASRKMFLQNVAPVESLVDRSCFATAVFSQDFRHMAWKIAAKDV